MAEGRGEPERIEVAIALPLILEGVLAIGNVLARIERVRRVAGAIGVLIEDPDAEIEDEEEEEETTPGGVDPEPEDEEPDDEEDIFKRPEGVPEDWVEKDSDKGEGKKYVDPYNDGNDIRIQRGKPGSQFPGQKRDYVKWKRNGQWLDKNGSPVDGNSLEAHIPIEDFEFNIEIFR